MNPSTPASVAVYLDVCCLNRLFDDPSQARVRLEAAAVTSNLIRIQRSELVWISSDVVNFEIERTSDPNRRGRVRLLMSDANTIIAVDDEIRQRAKVLERVGLGAADALHIACAERGEADVFLTVDDVLLKRARRVAAEIAVRVKNPLTWLGELG